MYNVQRERERDRYIEILIISDYSFVNMHILRDVKYVQYAHACMYITQKKSKTLILNSFLGSTIHFQVHVPMCTILCN